MQHRMLAVAALAAVSVAAPIAAAQGATSTAKVMQGVFYGGVTATGYPVVIQLSKTGRKVVKATIGLELKCQTPGDITLPDSFKNIPVSKAGKFSHTYGPEEIAADPATGVSKVQVTGCDHREVGEQGAHAHQGHVDAEDHRDQRRRSDRRDDPRHVRLRRRELPGRPVTASISRARARAAPRAARARSATRAARTRCVRRRRGP